jgi:hypothetical protein
VSDCHDELRQGWQEDAQAAKQADEEATWRARKDYMRTCRFYRPTGDKHYPTLCAVDGTYATETYCQQQCEDWRPL